MKSKTDLRLARLSICGVGEEEGGRSLGLDLSVAQVP